jgi:hypothetical protein
MINPTLNAYDIRRNTPIHIPFTTIPQSHPGDYLTFHITRGPHPRQGTPVYTCPDHNNKLNAYSPLYLELQITEFPWIRHPKVEIVNGHYLYTIDDFTNALGTYTAFPCPTACITQGNQKIRPWHYHNEGYFNGLWTQGSIPIAVKHSLQINAFKGPFAPRSFFTTLHRFANMHNPEFEPRINFDNFLIADTDAPPGHRIFLNHPQDPQSHPIILEQL